MTQPCTGCTNLSSPVYCCQTARNPHCNAWGHTLNQLHGGANTNQLDRLNAQEDTGSLRGRALLVARLVLLAVALLTVGLFLASVPLEYQRLGTVSRCVAYGCIHPQLTPDMARALDLASLSASFFAGYFIAVEVIFAAVWFTVAALIFARKPDDPAAMLVVLMLLTYGATFANLGVLSVYPRLELLVTSILCLGEICFGLFPLTFPDGRFVPRWSRWLALAYAVYLVLFYFLAIPAGRRALGLPAQVPPVLAYAGHRGRLPALPLLAGCQSRCSVARPSGRCLAWRSRLEASARSRCLARTSESRQYRACCSL